MSGYVYRGKTYSNRFDEMSTPALRRDAGLASRAGRGERPVERDWLYYEIQGELARRAYDLTRDTIDERYG